MALWFTLQGAPIDPETRPKWGRQPGFGNGWVFSAKSVTGPFLLLEVRIKGMSHTSVLFNLVDPEHGHQVLFWQRVSG